jgi:hypothetical protein
MSRTATEAVPEYVRAELEGLRRQADLGDLYGLLGVAQDAARPQVIQAYVDMVRKLRAYGDRYDLAGFRVEDLLRSLGSAQAVLTDAIQRYQYDQKVRHRSSSAMPAVGSVRDRAVAPEPVVLSHAERAQEAWSPSAEATRSRSPSQGAMPAVDAPPGSRPRPPTRTPSAEYQPVPSRVSSTHQVVTERPAEHLTQPPAPAAAPPPPTAGRGTTLKPEAALEGAVNALDELVRELTGWRSQTELLLRHVDTVAAATQATLSHLQGEPGVDCERVGRSLTNLAGLRRRLGGR